MNEYIAEFSNLFAFDELVKRSWQEIALVLSPSVLLIFLLFGYIGFLKTKLWQWTIYVTCFVLLVVYMPYELMRQSTEMSRAQANIDEIHDGLQEFLDAAKLGYVSSLNSSEVAASMLDEVIDGLDAQEKKELIVISWIMAENEKQALRQIDNKQRLLADDIKTSVSTAKNEIIDSRAPVEKISGDVVKRLEADVNHLLEDKMNAFKQEIDNTLDNFEKDINTFIQVELGTYEEKLAAITQQNVDELRDYSSKASRSIAQHVNKINKESLQRLDDTKVSIDGIGAAISNIDLQAVIRQISELSSKVESAQKKNDILFEYSECMRSTGMLDLGGKKDECKSALDSALNEL
ncbi:hypothetical protein [Nitrosomonas aestuarii]|uniref:Uncharacterized protein n=1 Tax=Nitrosomonas aestuarii TaxID=52441 RepID=A0A1I4CEC2_9PROT|nr:hypothetical protein [Nitrosomonas aestuarii]PTN12132.1 hypothetical protein C8R11_10594 [Nitrosomonas aestuarii]SFK78667.1 hypothetical protein SAMN05216302_101543 [Nitrosomonas aestuarii]